MPADSSLSLKPLLIEEIFGIVKRLRDERNLTVLLVEHNGALALDIADHGYVMETAASCWKAGPKRCARIPISESPTSVSTKSAPTNNPTETSKLQAAHTLADRVANPAAHTRAGAIDFLRNISALCLSQACSTEVGH